MFKMCVIFDHIWSIFDEQLQIFWITWWVNVFFFFFLWVRQRIFWNEIKTEVHHQNFGSRRTYSGDDIVFITNFVLLIILLARDITFNYCWKLKSFSWLIACLYMNVSFISLQNITTNYHEVIHYKTNTIFVAL